MILNTVLKVKGGRVNNSEQLIALKESETAFLKYFNKADYELVDFSLVEKLDWKQLNHEDLQQMGERNFWQHEHQIYALRNDFTDQLLRYYSMYPTAATKVAYTGLIIRNNEAAVQVGLENYAPSLANVQQSLKLFIQFIQQQLRDNVHFVVLGHYQLLDALLDKSLQTPDILSMIEERNLSGLVTYLSTEHPIVQILKENTQQQLNVLEHYIPNDHPALNAQQFLNQFSLEAPLDESLYPIIRDICQEVKVHGDKALKMYNLTFDHTKTDHLEISHEQIKAAFDTLDEKTKQALQQSYERIKAYQESIKQMNQQLEESVECYEIYHPLESVGIYVPGGKASYPSTVLMTATLAQVAGVENIVVVTPPQPNGVSQEVLAACYITQVNQVFQVGGAQSIAALTYGTETIPKVDKIVGPGNQFVAYAKKYLFGQVGIDQIAGPTEIALIIDDTADLDAIVYDVFAQAEHDELARTYVISEDAQVLKDLESRIAKALPNVDRYDIVSKSIANQHYLIHASNFDEACHVMNTIAPEHASIQTVNPQPYIEKVKYVGALFIGHYSPEVIGDYVAGPSHVLPTNRTARFTNGLSVNDFLTRNTVIHLSKDTFDQIADSAQHIAHVEALYNHQQSILIRQS